MNIGIVTAWFPCGAGYVSKAYRDVLQSEHSVFIYARNCAITRRNATWDDSRTTWAPAHYPTSGVWRGHFRRWIRANHIDLVLFNEQRCWQPVLLAKSLGVRAGAYVDYYTQQTVPAFSVYDFLICNTRRHHSVFKWHAGCHYVPWGTDTDRFKPAVIRPDRKVTFLHSAGWGGGKSVDNEYMDRRGARIAMAAFSRVAADCRFLLYSQSPLDQCSDAWRELIAADRRIEFRYGTFDPFPFHEGDVYVYPSRLEGIGLSLPEALSSGLAAIATDCAPMNEFVQDGVNGRLARVSRYIARPDGYYWPESICDCEHLSAIMQEYAGNPKLVSEHQRQSRQQATVSLDWRTNAHNLLEIVEQSRLTPVAASARQLCYNLDVATEPDIVQSGLRFGNSLRQWLGCLAGLSWTTHKRA
jgi:1,2-diacylglycerol 3-alpha-glucosyltransferase